MHGLLVILVASAALSQTPTHRDVPYGDHERHKLDVWLAESNRPTPLLVFIHGGGWHGGDKADVPAKLVHAMLDEGVSVASINYRFSWQEMLPAPQRDAARAVQFLRSKATEWHLNPDRFAAYGISAGGCSSLWLATHDDLAMADRKDPIERQSTRLSAAVGMSPQTCLEPAIITSWIGEQVLAHPMIARAVQAPNLTDMKSPRPEWVALLHEASPITHVSDGDPPILISNPSVDPLPATSAGSAIHHAMFGVKMKDKCDPVNVTCTLRIEDRADSSVPTPESFLLQHLLPKP